MFQDMCPGLLREVLLQTMTVSEDRWTVYSKSSQAL